MSHRLHVLIPEPLETRIRKAARRKRLSTGAWVRQALEAALKDDRTAGPLLVRAGAGEVDLYACTEGVARLALR